MERDGRFAPRPGSGVLQLERGHCAEEVGGAAGHANMWGHRHGELLLSRGHLAMSRDIAGCQDSGEGETQDAATHATVHRTLDGPAPGGIGSREVPV